MRLLVGGFAVALGLFALVFTDELVKASERTRKDFTGSGSSGAAKGWSGFSTIMTRLVGVFMIVVGVLVLINVLDVR